MIIPIKFNPNDNTTQVIMDATDLEYILDVNIPRKNIEITRDTFGNKIKTYSIDDDTVLTLFITPDDIVCSCSIH